MHFSLSFLTYIRSYGSQYVVELLNHYYFLANKGLILK